MNWRYEVRGTHTHVRVFMNGGKCGDLCFRNEEFAEVRANIGPSVEFFDETRPPQRTPIPPIINAGNGGDLNGLTGGPVI